VSVFTIEAAPRLPAQNSACSVAQATVTIHHDSHVTTSISLAYLFAWEKSIHNDSDELDADDLRQQANK
jgi:hypothetical protein